MLLGYYSLFHDWHTQNPDYRVSIGILPSNYEQPPFPTSYIAE